MAVNKLVAGDTASTLYATCLNSAGNPVDLTDVATVNLKYNINNGATVTRIMSIVNTPDSDPPITLVDGQVFYTFGSGDLIAGTLFYKVQLVYNTSQILTSTNWATLLVEKAL